MLGIKSQYSKPTVQKRRAARGLHPAQIEIAVHAQAILCCRMAHPKHEVQEQQATRAAHQYSQSRRRGLGSGRARSARLNWKRAAADSLPSTWTVRTSDGGASAM